MNYTVLSDGGHLLIQLLSGLSYLRFSLVTKIKYSTKYYDLHLGTNKNVS